MDASGDADEFRRQTVLFECVLSVYRERPFTLNGLRALESIKDKSQILPEQSDTAEHVEEVDRIGPCAI